MDPPMVLDRFMRGLRMGWESLKVIRRFPRLLVLPLVAGILVVTMWAAVFLPLFLSGGVDVLEQSQGLVIVLFLALYFASFFVAFLFEAALIDAAADHFRGEEVNVRASLRQVWGRKGPIFVWAILAGTVGLVLRAIASRGGIVARLVISFIGLLWNLASLLVLPTLIYEDVGAWEGLKRSVGRFKETWGETTAGHVGIGFLFGLLGLGVALVAFLLFLGLAPLGVAGIVVAVSVSIVLFALVALGQAAAHGIFVAALYTYVQTGEVPSAYTREYIERPYVVR